MGEIFLFFSLFFGRDISYWQEQHRFVSQPFPGTQKGTSHSWGGTENLGQDSCVDEVCNEK